MEDISIKYQNTAKMLGANPKQALEFGNACNDLAWRISPSLKTEARQTIIKTILLDKTFEEWANERYGQMIEANNNCAEPDKDMMSLNQVFATFGIGIVLDILQMLITKQAHQ